MQKHGAVLGSGFNLAMTDEHSLHPDMAQPFSDYHHVGNRISLRELLKDRPFYMRRITYRLIVTEATLSQAVTYRSLVLAASEVSTLHRQHQGQ